MRYGEQFTFLQLPYHGDPYPADSRPLCNSITLTPEAGEILSIILEQLADFPSPQKGALLLTGDVGVDKPHLLRYLECMLANPEYPLWNSLLKCLNLSEEVRPKAPIRSLFLQIPMDPSRDLGICLADSFQWNASPSILPPASEISPNEFLAQMEQAAPRMAEKFLGMVVLENVSERIEQFQNAETIQSELRLYRILSEVFSQNGILTVFVGKERHLTPEDPAISLLTGGEELDRNYSWIEYTNPSSFTLPPSVMRREEEFNECLQLLIYDWIQSEIPSWQPEHGPRYRHDSQALAAPIPEGGRMPAGLVYFKSVFDPYWTDEDLARLEGAAYPWILMILSPCERFYEFENRLRDIVSRLQMLVIWRPDTPSKTEFNSLRSLALRTEVPAGEAELPSEEAFRKIRPILVDLYITRGHFLRASGSIAISREIKNQSIRSYLSACLSDLWHREADAAAREASQAPGTEPDHRALALQWAALLAERPELRDSSPERAREQLIEWWTNSAEPLSRKLPDLPEAFQTTRFWGEVKHIENPLLALKPIFHSLHTKTFSLFEAMDHVGLNFAWDKDRLLKWKRGLTNLRGLALWLPAFSRAREYLCAAFPIDRGRLDHTRESLLQSMDDPLRFLEGKARNEFDERFSEFKKRYMDSYFLLHEDALHIMDSLKKDEVRINPVLLRNLDLLSGLQYSDKSCLNRVKLLAKWIQRNQCNLPLRQILEHYPRCYCNFNPCGNQQPATSAEQINAIIQEGIEYFRTLLRRCGYLILEDLKSLQIDDNSLKQITVALSDGPMIPLNPQSIKILNWIIGKHTDEFLAEVRKLGKRNRSIQ